MCDFFYNNWSAILVTFIGAFFAFGLALLLNYWNICHNKKKEKKAIEDENANKVEYYVILLEEAVRKTENQVKLIDEYNKKQKGNLLYPISLKRIPSNVFIRLKNIDNRGVFEALADKFKSDKGWLKKYNNLNYKLDFIEGVLYGELVRINRNTYEKISNDLLFIGDLINKIPNILRKEAIAKKKILGKNGHERLESIFIDNEMAKWQKLSNESADLNRLNTELLVPLIKNISAYKEQLYAQNIMFDHYEKVRIRMASIETDIGDTISLYDKIKDDLEKCIKEVKEMMCLIRN